MKNYRGKLDRLGIAVSFLCLIHCIVLPVLLTLSMTEAAFLHHPSLEAITLVAAILVGSGAMWKGYQKHEQYWISLVFAIGIALMVISNLAFTIPYEAEGKAIGAIMVISAHFKNYRLSNCAVVCLKIS